jgi:hypothetical protein
MKLGMITDSVADLDFAAMLALTWRVGLDALEFGCGNWSSARPTGLPGCSASRGWC